MRLSPQTRHSHVTDLAAQSLAGGSAAIGQPAFGQVHNISPVGIPAGVLTPFGQTPEEVGFEKLLIEIISASFDRRTKSKPELVEMGITKFRLSRRRAGALREQVIDRLGAIAWKAAGRRRRN
jgi:hypothetical protein